MKNLRQRMTTAFGLMLVALAVAACAPEQTFAKVKGRTSANHINVALGDGSVKVKRPQTNRKDFDRGYLKPYAANTYTGTTTVNQGRRNNLTVNAGSGNDTFNVQRRTAKPNQVVVSDFNGDQILERRKNNPTVSTYNLGEYMSAKMRGRLGH